jgi:hypothetical protein
MTSEISAFVIFFEPGHCIKGIYPKEVILNLHNNLALRLFAVMMWINEKAGNNYNEPKLGINFKS